MQNPLVVLAQVLVAPCIKAARRWMLWGVALCCAAACAPFVVPTGGDSAPPRFEALTYVAIDGARLPLKVWEPAARPTAVVLALHGFGDYANAFDAAGTQLAAAGIRTVAYDQRGFGASPQRGYWAGVDRMVDDAADAVQLLSKTYPGAPIYLLGESMGGAIAMVLAAERPSVPLAGVVLVAPAVWGRPSMTALERNALWLAAHTVPWFPLTGQGLNVQPSDNFAMLRKLSQDKLILHHFRADLVWGLANAMDRAVAAAAHIQLPSLFLYGLRDELVPLAPTRRALMMVPADKRRVAVYPSGFHMLLRDLGGKEVVDDLVAWVKAPSAPLPSGADRSGIDRLLTTARR
jgi:acylglycerol lipase